MNLTASEQKVFDRLKAKLSEKPALTLNKAQVGHITKLVAEEGRVVVVLGGSGKISVWALEHYLAKVEHGKVIGKK